jgi:hypothetical protein
MWNNQFATATRHFLSTEAGRAFLIELDARRPVIDSQTIEGTALSAREMVGFEKAQKAMEELANYQEERQSDVPRFVEQYGRE